jgi:hypothetical protein
MSCNMIIPNTLRSMDYEAYSADSSSGNNLPGISTYPILYRYDGTLIDITDPTSPIMVPTKPEVIPASCNPILVNSSVTNQLTASYSCPLNLFIGGSQVDVINTGVIGAQHLVLMNLEDPHAQIASESWTVTYEGPLPSFDQQTATLQPAGAEPGLYDPNSEFCDGGVLSENAWRDILRAEGKPQAAIDALAPELADYVQIALELPLETDVYWNDPARGACTYSQCLEDFGTGVAAGAGVAESTFVSPGRDLRIVEAFQDHLDLVYRHPTVPKGQDLAEINCCFPEPLQYNVRGGTQWIAIGTTSGFLHDVVADPITGACRNSCDPIGVRKNARIREAPSLAQQNAPLGTTPIFDGGEFAFINPELRFAITQANGGGTGSVPSERDMQFRFATLGAFAPLLVPLSTDPTVLVQPNAITYLPTTGEVVITDGATNGIIFVTLDGSTVTRSYF